MSFVPKEDLLQLLMGMGISRNAASWALFYTGNHNADLAAAYVFENPDNQDLEAAFDPDTVLDESSGDSEEEAMGMADVPDFLNAGDFYKMVFVVNSDLGMSVGKIAAQVAHATLTIYKTMIDNPQAHGAALHAWEQFGETKIVLKGEDTKQLTTLASQAQGRQLPHYLVQDAGLTQVPAGSKTVLGIMGQASVVDQITGSLPLL